MKVKRLANDNGKDPQILFENLESPPLCVVEVEIFDVLISNIKVLVANDNDAPVAREKNP